MQYRVYVKSYQAYSGDFQSKRSDVNRLPSVGMSPGVSRVLQGVTCAGVPK